jgi:hypothetical protein
VATNIQYVGLKPVKTDNVAGTTAVWNGHGAVCRVNDAAAEKMLRHPDVWALAVDTDAPALELAEDTAPPVLDHEEEEKDRVVHQVNLQKMGKGELVHYAAQHFNITIAPETTIQEMRKQVRDLRVGAGIRNG